MNPPGSQDGHQPQTSASYPLNIAKSRLCRVVAPVPPARADRRANPLRRARQFLFQTTEYTKPLGAIDDFAKPDAIRGGNEIDLRPPANAESIAQLFEDGCLALRGDDGFHCAKVRNCGKNCKSHRPSWLIRVSFLFYIPEVHVLRDNRGVVQNLDCRRRPEGRGVSP